MVAAFHISEYLISEEKPWPYVDDFSLSAIGLMTKYIETILEYDFD
jgi:hypothetical protein